jgi:predicted Zn-dependent protease
MQMSGYLLWYLVPVAVAYGARNPGIAAAVVVVYLLRHKLPDPVVWTRTSGRIRALRFEIAANPSNITARRDLARLWLDRLRPRAACKIIDEALAREPSDPELLYLRGLARLRIGDSAGAIDPIVNALRDQPKLLFGEPYLIVARALLATGRLEEAEEALQHYVAINSSTVQGHALLAQVYDRMKKPEARAESLKRMVDTYATIPSYRRRGERLVYYRTRLKQLFGM